MSRAKAIELLRMAANQGHRNAQDRLSFLCAFAPPQGTCASCGAESAPLKCFRCKAAMYFSKACQVEHWKRGVHRDICAAVWWVEPGVGPVPCTGHVSRMPTPRATQARDELGLKARG